MKETSEMMVEAMKDKSKKGKEMVRLLSSIDDNLVRITMKTYLERCSFKYILAFLQWRYLTPNADDFQLMNIFNSRVNNLLEKLKNSKKCKFNTTASTLFSAETSQTNIEGSNPNEEQLVF